MEEQKVSKEAEEQKQGANQPACEDCQDAEEGKSNNKREKFCTHAPTLHLKFTLVSNSG